MRDQRLSRRWRAAPIIATPPGTPPARCKRESNLAAAALITPSAGLPGRRQRQAQPFAPALALPPAPREAAATAGLTGVMLTCFRADPAALRVAVERQARAARAVAWHQWVSVILRSLRAPALS